MSGTLLGKDAINFWIQFEKREREREREREAKRNWLQPLWRLRSPITYKLEALESWQHSSCLPQGLNPEMPMV
jgi:hypothetical protein